MTDLVYLVPLLPLFGFVTLVFAGSRMGEPLAGWFATAAIGGSFLASVGVWFGLRDLGENPAAIGEITPPRLCELHRAGGPVQ